MTSMRWAPQSTSLEAQTPGSYRTVQLNVYVLSTCLEFKQVQPGVWFRERKGIFTRTLLPVRGSTPKVQIQKVL